METKWPHFREIFKVGLRGKTVINPGILFFLYMLSSLVTCRRQEEMALT